MDDIHAFDHPEAKVEKKDADEVPLSITNKTAYDQKSLLLLKVMTRSDNPWVALLYFYANNLFKVVVWQSPERFSLLFVFFWHDHFKLSKKQDEQWGDRMTPYRERRTKNSLPTGTKE